MPPMLALSGPVHQPGLCLPPALWTQFDGFVDLIIVETVFPTLLIPIAVCLSFTNPEIQRKPVFILNVISVTLGLVFGSMSIAIISRFVTGRPVGPEFITALTALYFCIPLSVQCILFVRILAVYPPRAISALLALAIYGTLLSMTVARIVNISVALKKVSDTAHSSGSVWAVTTGEEQVSSMAVELSLALIYDIIASSLFLYRLRQSGAFKSMSAGVNGRKMSSPSLRLRTLFWIALTNFVLPVIFNVVLLAFFESRNSENTIAVIAVSSVNVYVQIISVLLATLWCAGTRSETSDHSLEGRIMPQSASPPSR